MKTLNASIKEYQLIRISIVLLIIFCLCFILSCNIKVKIDEGENLSISKIELTEKLYSSAFFSGVKIDSIDGILQNIYSKSEGKVDTTESGEWNKYARWRSFWSDRESVHGSLITGPQHYLAALNNLSDYEVCENSGGAGSIANWTSIGPDEGPLTNGVPIQALGAIFAIDARPSDLNTVYVGTGSGGIWKTTNALDPIPLWTNISDYLRFPSLGISDIVIAPSNTQVIYAAASTERHGYGLGVIKSTNAGSTWSETDMGFDPTNPSHIAQLLVDPNNSNIVYAHTENEVYRTDNGGINWPDMDFQSNSSNPNMDIQSMEFNLSDPNIIYLSGNEIWKGIGNSNTWTELSSLNSFVPTTTPTGFSLISFKAELSSYTDGCYALIDWNFSNGVNSQSIKEIKKYTESTNSWQSINITNRYEHRFIVNSTDPNIMYLAMANSVMLKSINGGASFFPISNYWPKTLYNGVSTHADIRDLKLLDSSPGGLSDVVLVGNDGGVLLSQSANSSGATHTVNWKNINGKGLAITEYLGISNNEFAPNLIHGGAQDNGLLTNDNNTWQINVQGGVCGIGDGYDCLVDVDHGDHAYGQTNYPQLRKTTNRGISWTCYTPPPFCNGCGSGFSSWWKTTKWPLFYDVNKVQYIGHFDLFKKVGNTWLPLSNFASLGANSDNLIAADVNKSNTDVIIAAHKGATWTSPVEHRLYRTDNGGITWNDITPSPTKWHSITDVISDPKNPNRIWVSYGSIGKYNGNVVSRVYYSSDGGSSWEDWSFGLTEFPANSLAYQDGSNDLIYVGTDVGVFYREGGDKNTPWICYNQDLPAAIVNDVEINYCAEKLRISTFGRGIWESDLAQPIANWGDEVITSSVTYSGTKLVNKNIIIEPGASLTISSSAVLNIFTNRKIIVKPGGLLTIDGGTLTNSCGKYWSGIEVWGNSLSPVESHQGKLIIKNKGTISNAHEAIRLHKPGTGTTHGGVVKATEGRFINNWRTAEFLAYDFDYSSRGYFHNCTFIINDDFPDDLNNPFAFVTMWKVDGIEFKGCFFNDQRTSNLNPMRGIYSIDAGYQVTSFCGATVPCPKKSKFKNLNYAIESANPNTVFGIEISQSVFEGNNGGVILRNVTGPKIVLNTFEIGKPSSGFLSSDFGLALQESDYFIVEQNAFIKAANHDYITIGLFVDDSGILPNQIYKNYFTNLLVGNWVSGKNSIGTDYNCFSGLEFMCNKSNGNNYDFYLTDVQRNQGWINLPAANTFSLGATSHITVNSGCGMEYHFNPNGVNQTPNTGISGTVNLFSLSQSNPCNPHYGGGNIVQMRIGNDEEFNKINNQMNASLASVQGFLDKRLPLKNHEKEWSSVSTTSSMAWGQFSILLHYIQAKEGLSSIEKQKSVRKLFSQPSKLKSYSFLKLELREKLDRKKEVEKLDINEWIVSKFNNAKLKRPN